MINLKPSYMPKSKSDVHLTPDRVWDLIKTKWGYSENQFYDPCPVNFKINGLFSAWHPLNYVNPPYTLLRQFVLKAVTELEVNGHITIMLLPAKTDQMWFHFLLEKEYDILWIQKRLKFKNNKWSATQPHFLVLIK